MASTFIIKKAVGDSIVTGLYKGKIKPSVKDKQLYGSPLGGGVVSDITIPAFTYTKNGRTIQVSEIKTANVVITCTLPQNIVKTAIQGADGTIKEYIGEDDWQISIEGQINGANGVHPHIEVANLRRLAGANIPFRITSSYLQNLDINDVVIEQAFIPQEAGGYSYQKFTLSCLSDYSVELVVR